MRYPVQATSRSKILGLLFLMALCPAVVGAQKVTVRGVVRDTAGRPLPDADVAIVSLHVITRTGENGQFSLRKVPVGRHDVAVRHLGYWPVTTQLGVSAGGVDSLLVAMNEQPAILAGVEVSAADHQHRVWIEDFYRRRAQGIGSFATREEILARNSFRPSDLFRTTPGVRIERGRGLRFRSTTDARRDCPPLLWIDGQRASGMDVDDLSLTDIEGIELYHGASTTPMQFSRGLTGVTCGTVVVWSRPPNSRTP